MLHPAMPPPGANRLVKRVRIDRLARQFAIASAKAPDGVGVERNFADRPEPYFCPFAQAALRHRIEIAYRLDFIPEQIQARRRLRAGREQVDQSAAKRVFAGFADDFGSPVPVAIQKLLQVAAVDSRAAR